MIKQFSLLLVVGLMLTTSVRTEEDLVEGEEEKADAKEGEIDVDAVEGKDPEDEIELEEAKKEDEGEKMKDLDTVVEEAKKEVEKLEDGPEKTRSQAIWIRRKVTGYKVVYGTRRVYQHCGCQAKPDTPKWEDIIEKILRATKSSEEMVLVVTTTSGYKYIYKCSTDMHYITYYQFKKIGGWKQKPRISIEQDFERYLGISVIQWTQKSIKLYGIVGSDGSTVIAFGRIEEFPYVLNRLWLNYLVAQIIQHGQGQEIKTYEVTWKGRTYRKFTPDLIPFLKKPYFLPEKNRQILFITVKFGDEIQVIPKPPCHSKVPIEWPDISFELPPGYMSLPPDLLGQDSVDSHVPPDSSGPPDSNLPPDSPSGSQSSEKPLLQCPFDSCEPMKTEDFTEENHGKSCHCQKRCYCSDMRKNTAFRGGKTIKANKPKKQRKKRSEVNSYSEFVELTKDCVTERKCRRAYTKFLNNGVIRLKEE